MRNGSVAGTNIADGGASRIINGITIATGIATIVNATSAIMTGTVIATATGMTETATMIEIGGKK